MLHICGNLLTMPPATKYHIKLLSTMYVNLDAIPINSFPKFNAARANSAQEDKEYIEEIDTGDEPLRGQDSPPTLLENAHSRRLGREDTTAQRLAAEAECITHSRRLRREDQTAQ